MSTSIEQEGTYISRPIFRFRNELARLDVEKRQVVHVANENELEAIDGRSELEQMPLTAQSRLSISSKR